MVAPIHRAPLSREACAYVLYAPIYRATVALFSHTRTSPVNAAAAAAAAARLLHEIVVRPAPVVAVLQRHIPPLYIQCSP